MRCDVHLLQTADGAVWLNKDLLSPFDYWQFWRNTADADVGRFLRIFTELSQTEIERLESLPGKEINAAKIVLADQATTMLHGSECLDDIRATAATLFEGASGSSTDTSALPRVLLKLEDLADGVPIVDLFLKLEFGKSKGEIKRLVSGGGARLNDEKVSDPALLVDADAFSSDREIKLSAGKKKHGIIELVD